MSYCEYDEGHRWSGGKVDDSCECVEMVHVEVAFPDEDVAFMSPEAYAAAMAGAVGLSGDRVGLQRAWEDYYSGGMMATFQIQPAGGATEFDAEDMIAIGAALENNSTFEAAFEALGKAFVQEIWGLGACSIPRACPAGRLWLCGAGLNGLRPVRACE